MSYCAGSWEVQDQRAGRFVVSVEGLRAGLRMACPLAVCFCTSGGWRLWRQHLLVYLALLIKAQNPSGEVHVHDFT